MGNVHSLNACQQQYEEKPCQAGGQVSWNGLQGNYTSGAVSYGKNDCGKKQCYYSGSNPNYHPNREAQFIQAAQGKLEKAEEEKKKQELQKQLEAELARKKAQEAAERKRKEEEEQKRRRAQCKP